MKKIVLILMFVTVVSNAQWVQVNSGMGNDDVQSLTSGGNYIFAGTTNNGLFLSTNNGTNWILSFSLNNTRAISLAMNGNLVFAGIYNPSMGIYLSTNNGSNWTQTSLNNRDITSIVINGNSIFAGSWWYGGVYLSTNNGTTWTQTSSTIFIQSLAINGNNLFAGIYALYSWQPRGVYLSTNNGTNFTQTSLNNQNINVLTISGNYIFAGTGGGGVFLSTNNGSNWTQTSLNNQDIRAIVISQNSIFAGSWFRAGVFLSTNNGTTWIQRNEGFPNPNIFIYALCISNNFIFAGTYGNGVYRRPLSELIGIQPISTEIPNQFSLSQNYPNPFNPVTKIKFGISKDTRSVSLRIYDALGREVAMLVNEQLKPGIYEVDFDGSNFASGIYYYTLSASTPLSTTYTETKKMVLMK